MSSKPSGPQTNGRRPRPTKSTLPDELVARVKRDLKTMTRKQVARKHILSESRVRSIDEGTAYASVEPAPSSGSGLNSLDLIAAMLGGPIA